MRELTVVGLDVDGKHVLCEKPLATRFDDARAMIEDAQRARRVIFPCQCENAHKDDGIVISFCENCGAIYDQHTKLASPYIGSMTYNRMKSCSACVIA